MIYQRLASLIIVTAAAVVARAADAATFCNPLDLDYGVQLSKSNVPYRHGADPVIVLFHDRYYLYSTWDKPGYRVSDDLAHWSYIPFKGVTFEREKNYTAAAVTQIGDWLYFFELSRNPVFLYRTKDPDSGQWEKVTQIGPYADPCLFVDPPSGRIFVTYGLEKPIHIVELDRTTFQPVPGSDKELMPPYVPGTPIENGWEVCTWDNAETSPGMRGNKSFNPCREGSWLTFFNGTYYLQYASPGTTVPGYADGLLTSKSATGPYTYSNYSPISHKDSGFITSAGHSCLFRDRYGNWWRTVTQLIGVRDRFERRIGLFPAGFDKDGIPYTRTDLGDLPITLPTGPRDHLADPVHPNWQLLSLRKPAAASSSLPGHAPDQAADENIRTWWSAQTGNAGEYLQLDLGCDADLRALQVNLYEQGYSTDPDSPDLHQFTVTASNDGQSWQPLLDLSHNTTATPHHYCELPAPTRARYVRVTNVSTPGHGKFAVSDLRLFGPCDASKPAPATALSATRDGSDRRQVTLTWAPAKDATRYLLCYGITPEKLYQHYLITDPATHTLTLHSLNHEPRYFFRLDTINEGGVTEGTSTIEAR